VARVVRLFEAGIHPRAECQADGCRQWRTGATTLHQVKAHVKATGHEVLVIRETRTTYGREG
jgi:hypothetical protein